MNKQNAIWRDRWCYSSKTSRGHLGKPCVFTELRPPRTCRVDKEGFLSRSLLESLLVHSRVSLWFLQ